MASVIAESPPPITATSNSVKKSASQVAQYEIPFPLSSISFLKPESLGFAPVAIIIVLAS